MRENQGNGGRQRRDGWRWAGWGAAGGLFLLPVIGELVTDEMNWGAEDFIVFGIMLAAVGGVFELAVRISASAAYRAAFAVALATAFILIWMNLAVGIIGSEDNPANLMYAGVLAIGIVGALIARFRPYGMARTLVATAIAQALVGVIALVAGWGFVLILTAGFVALWLLSAWLFRKAGREQTPAGAAS